jgi:hypothetical protein
VSHPQKNKTIYSEGRLIGSTVREKYDGGAKKKNLQLFLVKRSTKVAVNCTGVRMTTIRKIRKQNKVRN